MITLTLRAKTMLGYLPPYWHEYKEMLEILQIQADQLDKLDDEAEAIFTDSFILKMSESRIEEWESWLGLPPNGTLDDRRMAILSYFAVVSKMTRESIEVLVASLYNNARAIVVFKDSTIKIDIKPLPDNDWDELDFQRLLDQLNKRKPCHIALTTKRWLCTWGDIKNSFNTWQALKDDRNNWQHVIYFIPN